MRTAATFTFEAMKQLRFPTWFAVMIASFLIAGACGGGGDSAKTADDDPAPPFQFGAFGNENYEAGELISLDRFSGKALVVNFWFPSCAPCRAEMPEMEDSFRRHRADGLEFIGIQLVGLDSKEDGQKFINELGITYAIGADPNGSIFEEYGVISFPTTFFLDRSHNIVRKYGGFVTAGKLEEQIQNALTAETNPTTY